MGGKNIRNNKSRRRGKSVRHLFRGGVGDEDDNDNGSVGDGDDNDNGSVGDGDDDGDNDTDDDEEDDMALFHAVQSQNARTLKALLVTESSRINDLSNEDWDHVGMGGRQWTLLHLALINEDEITSEDPSLEIVQMLLNVKGLDVNKKDSEGKTPLMVAKGVEFVKLLLGHRDINVNERDNNGSTALWLLANLHGPDEEEEEEEEEEHRADTLEIAQLLIDAGADVNIRGADGTTPLEAAEKRGFTEYVEKFSKIKRRLPFAKALHSIKGINEDTAKMKVLQNEDLQREIRDYL